jgi:hypothetical protein
MTLSFRERARGARRGFDKAAVGGYCCGRA